MRGGTWKGGGSTGSCQCPSFWPMQRSEWTASIIWPHVALSFQTQVNVSEFFWHALHDVASEVCYHGRPNGFALTSFTGSEPEYAL